MENKIYLKIHQSYRNVIAMCDEELIGKKFDEGIKQLNVTESFYKGQLITKKEAQSILHAQDKEDATFNIVGEKSVALALETDIIAKESIGYVNKIPFALKLL